MASYRIEVHGELKLKLRRNPKGNKKVTRFAKENVDLLMTRRALHILHLTIK